MDGSTEIKVGKLKSATSKRDIPLNDTAIKMIEELSQEYYFGENTPLICDEHGNYTKPDVFRRRYHRLLEGAGIPSKGLHSLRHTFATNLVNGVKQADGTIKALTVKQVADLLGHSTTQVTEMYYMKKDKIDANTVMYLINALTFDAKWATKYEKKDVGDGHFTNYDGTQKTVQMLSSEERTYFATDGVKGFAKNYAGDRYSIVALLPDQGTDIYDYIGTLDGAGWMNLWNSRESASVKVKMPEFTYSVSMKLNDTLKTMGMTDMFSDSADFSKLGYSERGNIYCSEVCQKVFIQVDRNGTKAAAITWGGMKDEAVMEAHSVILDRPFVYAIVDNATGLPIFIGAVTAL